LLAVHRGNNLSENCPLGSSRNEDSADEG